MKTNYTKYMLAVLLLVAGISPCATAQDAAGNVVLGIVPQEREQQLTVQQVAADTPPLRPVSVRATPCFPSPGTP